jgi:hypothetical protein
MLAKVEKWMGSFAKSIASGQIATASIRSSNQINFHQRAKE